MNKCTRCGARNRNTALYCQGCGAALAAPGPAPTGEDVPVLDDEALDLLEEAADEAVTPPEPVPAAAGTHADHDGHPLHGAFEGLEPAAYRLEVLTGPNAYQTATVTTGTPVTANSTPASALCLKGDAYVSQTHATLRVERGSLIVKDEGSTNGTYVRVRDEQALDDGDILLFGWTQVRVHRES